MSTELEVSINIDMPKPTPTRPDPIALDGSVATLLNAYQREGAPPHVTFGPVTNATALTSLSSQEVSVGTFSIGAIGEGLLVLDVFFDDGDEPITVKLGEAK